MADRKISDLTALTTPAAGDYLPIVDISEPSNASKNKRITIEELLRGAPDGTAGAPGIAFESDPDSGIYSAGANQVAISTGGTGRLFVDASGNVGVNATPETSTGRSVLTLNGTSGDEIRLNTAGTQSLAVIAASGVGVVRAAEASGYLRFDTGGANERLRIDSSGRLLVGTSTARTNIDYAFGTTAAPFQIEQATALPCAAIVSNYDSATVGAPAYFTLARAGSTAIGSTTIVADGNYLGEIDFSGSDGTDFTIAASIHAAVDGTPGANDMPGRLVFSTTADGAASPTERMRINSSGLVLIGATSLPGVGTSTTGVGFGTAGVLTAHRTSNTSCYFGRTDDGEIIALYSGNTQRGTVSISGATTTYGSVSDYRLKERIAPISEAASKVSRLKPSRFNFIEFPDQDIDGFIAHEVQEVVPEAVIGNKDATDEDGKPIYQSIDQSKLVPLLTAALQEALQKIEDLEARLDAANL